MRVGEVVKALAVNGAFTFMSAKFAYLNTPSTVRLPPTPNAKCSQRLPNRCVTAYVVPLLRVRTLRRCRGRSDALSRIPLLDGWGSRRTPHRCGPRSRRFRVTRITQQALPLVLVES